MKAGDWQKLASVLDPTIDTHEQGHHINSSLSLDHLGLNRMIEEIMADYLAKAPTEEPTVGRFFAHASALVAQRLRARDNLDQHEVRTLLGLERQAKTGYLRSFETQKTIATINRKYILSNSYDGGDPARAFLWNIRQRLTPDQRLDFDSLTLRTIEHLGYLPMVISMNANLMIGFRTITNAIASFILTKSSIKKIIQKGDPRLVAIFKKAKEELNDDPDALARIENAEDKEAKRKEVLIELASKIVTEDGYNLEIEAEQAVLADRVAREDKFRRPRLWRTSGFGGRPRVEADYVLPELFRAYYRMAQQHAPQFADMIKEEAGRAMDASVFSFSLNDGTKEIAFFRRGISWKAAAARYKMGRLLRQVAELRAEWEQVLERGETQEHDVFEKAKDELRARYAAVLDGVQEFERTHSLRRLYYPFTALKTVKKLFQKVTARIESSSDKKASGDSCEESLKKTGT